MRERGRRSLRAAAALYRARLQLGHHVCMHGGGMAVARLAARGEADIVRLLLHIALPLAPQPASLPTLSSHPGPGS